MTGYPVGKPEWRGDTPPLPLLSPMQVRVAWVVLVVACLVLVWIAFGG